MNLLFRVLDAAHCRSTHHKLAMDALRLLKRDDASAWSAVFLKHHMPYLQGAKEPDVKFKDFRNHVLHVSDGLWGGARQAARLWYDRAVDRLRHQDWVNAVYAAGILSHYYTDPIQPFHTGQSEAENNIHRACEWSITRSYDALRAINNKAEAWPRIEIPDGDDWLEKMVVEGAEKSHRYYQPLIDHYNFEVGRRKPEQGLDDLCRQMLAELTAYAAAGFAGILDRMLDEAAVPPPQVSFTLETFLVTLEMPLSWVTRKLEDRADRRAVQAMYDELQSTGKVDKTLPEDDRAVRDLHRVEILGETLETTDVSTATARSSDTTPAAAAAAATTATAAAAGVATAVTTVTAAVTLREKPGTRATADRADAVASPKPQKTSSSVQPAHSAVDEEDESESDEPAVLKFRLDLDMPVEQAPSIGPKTAARMEAVGIVTVRDFLEGEPSAMCAMLNAKHITAEDLEDWQAQTLLACEMPGIHGHDAQILVACGYDEPVLILEADPDELLASVTAFVQTADGQRVLRSSRPPDAGEVARWIDWAGHARDLRAA